MGKHIVLIDGNSIAHANHNANELTVGGMQVQAIYGYLRTLRAMRQGLTGNVEFLNLWDGRAQWRIDLYPEYKGNRVALDAKQQAHKEAFKRQTPFIEKFLETLGIKQFRSPHLEADDLAGHFVRTLMQHPGVSITLVTGDQDWLGLVRDGVTWFDPIRNRSVDTSNFFEFTGYLTTSAFVQGKALQGDTSDNVDGIPGIGEKTARDFLAFWKSVPAFFKAVDSGAHKPKERGKGAKSLHPEQILASPEGRALFIRNVKLMDLARSRAPEKGEVIIKAPQPDPAKFLTLCERLAFASILRERHAFLDTFGLKVPEGYDTEPGAPVAKAPTAGTLAAAAAGVEAAAAEFEDIPF